MPVAPKLVACVVASVAVCGAVPALAADAAARPRQRRVPGGLRPGNHELKDTARWPPEPGSPAGPIDADRFRAALGGLCREMLKKKALAALSAEVLEAAVAAGVDPFLLGALAYRQSRCDARLRTGFGIGLLQIQPAMYAAGELPVPRSALAPSRLADRRHNLGVGAKLLRMWQDEHPTADARFPGVPHRTPVAHFIWGDRVVGTGGEDRALTARRRLVEGYLGTAPAPRACSLGFPIVSPLEGAPRVAPSGPGEDRAGGERAHRGLDLDATGGEPVRSIADGVVWFTGADLPGRVKPEVIEPEALPGYARVGLGPGGLFVCVRHAEGVFSCYFHLSSYRVHINDRVKAGDEIAAVGRSGVKSSGSHLHLEIHVDGKPIDPAPVLGPDLCIPPQDTVAHTLAMASKKHRLRLERRARNKARIAAREAAGAAATTR